MSENITMQYESFDALIGRKRAVIASYKNWLTDNTGPLIINMRDAYEVGYMAGWNHCKEHARKTGRIIGLDKVVHDAVD